MAQHSGRVRARLAGGGLLQCLFQLGDPGADERRRFPVGLSAGLVIDHAAVPPQWHEHISGGYPSFYQEPLERYFAALARP